MAIGRQIGGTDAAAQANWWADYAEHVSLLGVAALIASSGRPGWRIWPGWRAAAWLYLGVVAVFLLPDHTASWGVLGGLVGIVVGLVLGSAAAIGDAAPAVVGRIGPRTVELYSSAAQLGHRLSVRWTLALSPAGGDDLAELRTGPGAAVVSHQQNRVATALSPAPA